MRGEGRGRAAGTVVSTGGAEMRGRSYHHKKGIILVKGNTG